MQDAAEVVVAAQGHLWVSDLRDNPTFPATTSPTSTLSSDWLDVGYITEDGPTFTVTPTVDINAWQSATPIRRLVTSQSSRSRPRSSSGTRTRSASPLAVARGRSPRRTCSGTSRRPIRTRSPSTASSSISGRRPPRALRAVPGEHHGHGRDDADADRSSGAAGDRQHPDTGRPGLLVGVFISDDEAAFALAS